MKTQRAIILLCATYFAVTVGRVVDGDTFDALVKIFPGQTAQVRVRVLGVDTPEKKGETMTRALEAQAFTRRWLTEGDGAQESVTIHACKFDTLSRLLGKVCRGGECLDESLIRAGLGRAR